MSAFTQETAVQDTGGREGRPAAYCPGHSPHDLAHAGAAGPPQAMEKGAMGLRIEVLARAIEHEIIPRLIEAHRSPPDCPRLPAIKPYKVNARDVEDFAMLVLSSQDDVAHAAVESLRSRGISVETIYLDLLAPVARYLGELWDQDLCDFAEVTLGLGRLQQVLRELSPAFSEPSGTSATGRRILLLPGPGEQHTFGLAMVAEFFRRAGWDVAGGGWEAGGDPLVMVRQEWFDVVGFSLGAHAHLSELCECIRSVRKAALNPDVGIMVGGPAFSQNPEFGTLVEADAVASDGRQATELAERLVARKPRLAQRRVRACQCHP